MRSHIMESNLVDNPRPKNFISTIKLFPTIDNGTINTKEFLAASTDLVTVIDKISKIFAPVKYDMQGNIEKIRRYYDIDNNKNACVLQLMQNEIAANGKLSASEGVLWLNRALLFIELVFLQIITCLHKNEIVSMKNIFTCAYEGSVKKYHSWASQQIFTFICKMCPTLPQIMKSFDVGESSNDVKTFQDDLQKLNASVKLVRCKIDDFFKEHQLFINK